jgi:hypothetical protein
MMVQWLRADEGVAVLCAADCCAELAQLFNVFEVR